MKKTLILAFAVLSTFAIYYFIGLDKIIFSLVTGDPYLVVLAFVLYLASLLIWSLRLRLFTEHRISPLTSFYSLMAGLAANNLVPLVKFGGEPVKAYIMKRRNGLRMREGISAVFLDDVSEILFAFGIISFALLSSFFLWNPPFWLHVSMFIGYLFFVSFLVLIFSIPSTNIVQRIFDFLYRKSFFKKRADREKFLRVFKTFKENVKKGRNRDTLCKAVLVTLVLRFLDFGKTYLLLMSLGLGLSLVQIVILYGIMIFVLFIPATPGSLGVAEGGEIFVLTLFGVGLPAAAAFAFLDRLFTFWFTTLSGSAIGVYYGVDVWKEKSSESRVVS